MPTSQISEVIQHLRRAVVVLEPPSKNWVKVQIDGNRAGWVNLNHVVAVSPTVFTIHNQMRTTILGDIHR